MLKQIATGGTGPGLLMKPYSETEGHVVKMIFGVFRFRLGLVRTK